MFSEEQLGFQSQKALESLILLPNEVGDVHHEMMKMVSCMSETAPLKESNCELALTQSGLLQ